MDLSDDFFDEPPVNQARAGGKFQPRAKQKPRKGTSVSAAPTRPSDTKNEGVMQSLSNLDAVQPVQSIDVVDNGLINPKGSSVLATLAIVGHEESLTQNETPASDVPVSDIPMWRKDVDLDLDPLKDVANTAPKNARAGGKFQPKAECGPTKETSQPILSTLQDGMEEKAAKAASSSLELDEDQVVQHVDVANDSRNLGKLNGSQPVATDEPSGFPLSDACDYFQLSTGKSAGEAADIFSELESLDPLLTQSSGGTKANASEKSNDRIEMDALPANKFVTSDYVSNSEPDLPYPIETAAVLVSNNKDTIGESEIPAPGPRIGDATEEAGAFPDMETEDIVTSGLHKGKFKPKTRSQRGEKKPSASVPQPAADESVMDPPNVQFVPSETECMEEGSVPVPPPGDVVDHLSVNLDDCTTLDASTREISTNEELGNLPKASNDDAAPSKDVPRMPEKSSKRGRKNAPTASNLSKKSKKNSTAANNEHEDETYNDGSINDEVPTCSVANDEDDDRDEDYMESTSTRKRATRKSKKPVIKNEKSAQKRKKLTKELDQSAKEPAKKFSHSTCRKRRCVDKALLEDDDIDFRRIAMKELILLAEHKERLEKKEAKASNVPLANQSTQNSSHVEDAHNEESSFASEQAQESTDDPVGYTTQFNTCFFNYQSYMNKESRARWSKQDTELFYEAIRQFGTDMSMIQQLFPGRTRHQIKLKFKNEERRHPMRISEAVASRAKDHSHFEKVIKQLKQVTAQAKRGSDGDDSIGVTGEEEVEELAPEINEEATKTKKDEDIELKDQGADVAEVHSPLKSNESEDDADMWDLYKNAF
ncbi:hypothetical protein SLE2022_043510 [Rubroshorea leprosula]